jgi:hypothetical protein
LDLLQIIAHHPLSNDLEDVVWECLISEDLFSRECGCGALSDFPFLQKIEAFTGTIFDLPLKFSWIRSREACPREIYQANLFE